MILEGIVTTLGPDGVVNIAPMGPAVPDDYPLSPLTSFELRPFQSSRTYANLAHHGEGVLHITDDVLLLAQAAIGEIHHQPAQERAQSVRGVVLTASVRAYEFRVVMESVDGPRARLRAEVLRTQRFRDFFGFNRAQFAVLESAILATRVGIVPQGDVLEALERLRPLVGKTGGPREQQAFALLEAHIRQRLTQIEAAS